MFQYYNVSKVAAPEFKEVSVVYSTYHSTYTEDGVLVVVVVVGACTLLRLSGNYNYNRVSPPAGALLPMHLPVNACTGISMSQRSLLA